MSVEAARARARRELGAAVLLCLTGGGLLLLAASRRWADIVVSQPAPLPATQLAPTGSDIGGLPGALGLVGLAAVVALAATRRWGRWATGVLLVLAGLGAAAASIHVLLDLPAAVADTDATAAELSRSLIRHVHPAPTVWPYLSVLGGLLLVVAGGLSVLRGRAWAVLSARYDAPGAPAPGDAAQRRRKEPAVEQWEALDRGEDPTS